MVDDLVGTEGLQFSWNLSFVCINAVDCISPPLAPLSQHQSTLGSSFTASVYPWLLLHCISLPLAPISQHQSSLGSSFTGSVFPWLLFHSISLPLAPISLPIFFQMICLCLVINSICIHYWVYTMARIILVLMNLSISYESDSLPYTV